MKVFKQVTLYSLLAVFAITLMNSCQTSNDVVSNKAIQKRKYRSGFYVSKKADQKPVEYRTEKSNVALSQDVQTPEVDVNDTKTQLREFDQTKERETATQASITPQKEKKSVKVLKDARRKAAEFSTEVMTATVVKKRAMDENLKMAIILACVATGLVIIGSILSVVTGTAIIYWLCYAGAVVCTVFAIIKLVAFFQTL